MTIEWKELQELAQRMGPPEWEGHAAYGVVIVSDDREQAQEVVNEILQWRGSGGQFPLRLPHYNASAQGLKREAETAAGGILVLQDIREFSPLALKELRRHIQDQQLSLVVLGTDDLKQDPGPFVGGGSLEQDHLQKQADFLGVGAVSYFDVEAADEYYSKDAEAARKRGSSPLRPPATSALEAVNRHRRRIGMGPLDPSVAGWTTEDIELEAARIAALNPAPMRMVNGDYEALKRRLMR